MARRRSPEFRRKVLDLIGSGRSVDHETLDRNSVAGLNGSVLYGYENHGS